MPGPVVDILMYHSVSNRGGATAIAPATFAAQMAAIAEAGVPVITLDDLLAAREGRGRLAARSVMIFLAAIFLSGTMSLLMTPLLLRLFPFPPPSVHGWRRWRRGPACRQNSLRPGA